MRLQKLSWVPQGIEITSIHIHPDNTRFAIAQGNQVNLFRTNAIDVDRALLGYIHSTYDRKGGPSTDKKHNKYNKSESNDTSDIMEGQEDDHANNIENNVKNKVENVVNNANERSNGLETENTEKEADEDVVKNADKTVDEVSDETVDDVADENGDDSIEDAEADELEDLELMEELERIGKVGIEKDTFNVIQQQICNVHDHNVNINCVRFAPSSKPNLLATCSADGRVTIFQRRRIASSSETEASPDINPSNNPPPVEEIWGLFHIFREHESDVLCVEWSPDGKYIASCGLDNKIIVYDVEEKRKFKSWNSEGIAKSVSWDPIGTYLAVQLGDENEGINIYHTRTWRIEKKITNSVECFKLPSGSGVFTHASWSPNGQFLLATGGRLGNVHNAPMFSRSGFDTVYMFENHKDATTVASFNPVLFVNDKNSKDYITYFAIGSRDKSVSIWSNKQQAPIAVISYFGDAITDLAWSSDGMSLLASSKDGTVNSIQFLEGELGDPLDKKQTIALLRKEYGDTLDYNHFLQEYDTSPTVIYPMKSREVEHNKRPREESITNEQYHSHKRLKSNVEEESSFVIRDRTQAFEVKLSKSLSDGEVEKIDKTNGSTLWKVHLNGIPSLAVSNEKFTAVSTSERSLYIISQKGRKISPEMILDSPAAFLACSKENFLVVLCDNCNMYAWDLSTQQCVLDINVYDLLTFLKDRPQDITNHFELISTIFITDDGTVIVITYSGEAFAYNTLNWRQWRRVKDDDLKSILKEYSNQDDLQTHNLRTISANV